MRYVRSLCKRLLGPYVTLTKRRRTVRYAFPALALVVAAVSANVLQSLDTAALTIEASDTQVRAGEVVRLHVFVTATQPVNTVDIAVNLPQQLISLNSIDTGESVITLWTEDPYFENGTVYLRGGTFRRGFTGKHLIATIDATAKTNGIARFSISDAAFYAGDGSGDQVVIEQELGTEIYIGDSAVFVDRPDSGGDFVGEAEVYIVTDIDGDGRVTLSDISRFLTAWRSKDSVFDFNGDGQMTFRDFGIILTDSFFR